MGFGDDFLFETHHFMLGLLVLFFVFFGWRDLRAKATEPLKRVSTSFAVCFLAITFIGLSAYFYTNWGNVGLVLGILNAALITISLYDPKFAVSFFVFTLISRPWEFMRDDLYMSFPRDIFFICLASFLVHRLIRKKFYFQWNKVSALVFMYASWVFLSNFVTVDVSRSLTNYGEVFIKGIMVYFLIVNVIDKKEYIRPVQSALVVSILEKAIVSFHSSVILGIVADGDRLTSVGILENSNDIAAIMILLLPFAVYLNSALTRGLLKYVLNILVVCFLTYLVWEAKSRGAMLGVGMFFAVLYWLNDKNRKRANILIMLGALALIGMVMSVDRKAEDIEGSTSNRKIYWTAGVNMAIRQPVLGVGYDNFPLRLLEFTNGHVGTEGKYKTIHSTWLLALAESGFPGFIFYMGIWLFCLKASWNMRVVHPEYILAVLSYGTAITFLSHTYMLYPWILLALITASSKFYRFSEVQKTEKVALGAEAVYA